VGPAPDSESDTDNGNQHGGECRVAQSSRRKQWADSFPPRLSCRWLRYRNGYLRYAAGSCGQLSNGAPAVVTVGQVRHITRSHGNRQSTFRERIQFIRVKVISRLHVARHFGEAAKKNIHL
jgi:hypothetical protein